MAAEDPGARLRSAQCSGRMRKQGLTIGMAMTEKQGGSDVRANTDAGDSRRRRGRGPGLRARRPQVLRLGADVRRVPRAGPGAGRAYRVSSCPAGAPTERKNPLQIIRLKRKMGNVSNASSETELRGALGWMVGAEGQGRGDDHRDGRDDPLRLHDRLVRRHADGGLAGDRPLPAAQGLRRVPDRPADHERRCSPTSRSRPRRR